MKKKKKRKKEKMGKKNKPTTVLPVADSSKLELGPVVVFVPDLETIEHPVHYRPGTMDDRVRSWNRFLSKLTWKRSCETYLFVERMTLGHYEISEFSNGRRKWWLPTCNLFSALSWYQI